MTVYVTILLANLLEKLRKLEDQGLSRRFDTRCKIVNVSIWHFCRK